jgi:hypothetical protein
MLGFERHGSWERRSASRQMKRVLCMIYRCYIMRGVPDIINSASREDS